jgi:hypothetical protein
MTPTTISMTINKSLTLRNNCKSRNIVKRIYHEQLGVMMTTHHR